MNLSKPYNIPITKVEIGEEELQAIQEPLRSGWLVQGPQVKKFEDRFSEYSGARHSIAATSCTTALHIAVHALGLKPGDEVIVPAFTWISTANVVEYMGGKPVFCDIELCSFNIDVEKISSLITKKTVGIIPVHLFGLCARMPEINAIAEKHGLWVIEDAACAFGSTIEGKHAGTLSDIGCFSFHPRKSITTGEGGMLTTGSDKLATMSRSLRDHGASRSDFSRHNSTGAFLLPEYNMLGYNYRMTDIQGALGFAQLNRAPSVVERRIRIAENYTKLLKPFGWLDKPEVPSGYTHSYQSYVCLFRPESPELGNVDKLREQRDRLMSKLEALGISTRQGTHAPVLLGYYAKKYSIFREDFPQALIADHLSISLPLYPQMSDEEQLSVVDNLARG